MQTGNQNPYAGLSLEITEDHMYPLMKEQVVNFIASFLVTLEENQIGNHDFISESK